jgi:predicted transcriptional regulator
MNSIKDSPTAIGRQLRAHFESLGLVQRQVGKRYSSSQAWIGRIYSGQFSARSQVARRMCADANIAFGSCEDTDGETPTGRAVLSKMVDSVWDGTEDDARLLVEFLRALKKLKRSKQ